ncbi:MAG TPA: hypothetical protein VGM27_07545 [Acidobacteriaceae bacterium]
MMKIRRLVPAFLLLAAVPVIPYAIWGYSGHDYAIHLTMWMELRNAWLHGEFVPGWCPLANFTLGSPRFCFYPPLSFLLGTLLSFIVPFRMAAAFFVWIVIFASGLSMYKVSGYFLLPEDRLAASVLYMLSPYLLFTALVRYAAAELLTLAWTPFVLLCFYRGIWAKEKRATVWLGCLFAMSWLANIPATIVLFYVLLVVAGIAAARQRALSPILHYFMAQFVGFMLAAFFLVPTYFEQKWISSAAVARPDLRFFFLFEPLWHFNGGSRFLLGFWAIACVEIAIVGACAYRMRKALAADSPQRTWLELAVAAFAFQLPVSIPLWRHLPELIFAGFPFRFLSVMGAAFPLLLLARGTPRSLRVPAYCLLCVTALFPVLVYATEGVKHPNPRFSEAIARWQKGYVEMAEFMPAGTTRPEAPTVDLASIQVDESGADCKAYIDSASRMPRAFSVDSTEPCRVRLALYYYPYWRALDEAGKRLPLGRTPEGLVTITVPPGRHRIAMKFKASSPLRTATLLVSAASALLVVVFALQEARRSVPNQVCDRSDLDCDDFSRGSASSPFRKTD